MPRPWLPLLDPMLQTLRASGSDHLEGRLALAKAYNARARHLEAIDLLDPILAQDRTHGEAWFERIVAEGEGFDQESLRALHRDLESLRDEHPDDPTPRRNLGYVRILQQRLDDAERALRQALERGGQDPRIFELMGLLALRRDQPQEAKAWFLKALTLQPKDPRTLRLLGLACEELGDVKGAETQFIAALEQDPCYFWGWHSLGEFLLRMGEVDEGLRCIHRARSLQVKEPASYFILAELFSELGHLEMAQAELHKLLLLGPSTPMLAEAYAMLGELRRDLGDREGAVSYFSLATETDPTAPNPWYALGELAREDERWSDALRCYHEALKRDPEAADVKVQMGYVYARLNRLDESEKAFLSALETDPTEYSAYLGLAECYRLQNRYEDEARMVKEAMVLAPEDPDVWNAQGVAFEVMGKLQEATEAYEHALQLAPLHRKAANNLGFVLEKRMASGEPELKERAIQAWKRRLIICRDEDQSLKMAMDHLTKLGIPETDIQRWLDTEPPIAF